MLDPKDNTPLSRMRKYAEKSALSSTNVVSERAKESSPSPSQVGKFLGALDRSTEEKTLIGEAGYTLHSCSSSIKKKSTLFDLIQSSYEQNELCDAEDALDHKTVALHDKESCNSHYDISNKKNDLSDESSMQNIMPGTVLPTFSTHSVSPIAASSDQKISLSLTHPSSVYAQAPSLEHTSHGFSPSTDDIPYFHTAFLGQLHNNFQDDLENSATLSYTEDNLENSATLSYTQDNLENSATLSYPENDIAVPEASTLSVSTSDSTYELRPLSNLSHPSAHLAAAINMIEPIRTAQSSKKTVMSKVDTTSSYVREEKNKSTTTPQNIDLGSEFSFFSMASQRANTSSDTLIDESKQTIKNNLVSLVESITSAIITLRAQDISSTQIELKHPPIFSGAIVTITEYASAFKEYNLTFTNLSPQARRLIENQDNEMQLKSLLEEKGYALRLVTIESGIHFQNTATATTTPSRFSQNTKERTQDNEMQDSARQFKKRFYNEKDDLSVSPA